MFRFTIRELILLTVIVAMGAAWWLEHRALDAERGRLRRAVEQVEREKSQRLLAERGIVF